MENLEDAIVAAKDQLPNVTPMPPAFQTEASAFELKSRLQWGEPGLTILDVRSHDLFNESRIQGAMNMPVDQLPGMAESSLQPQRDIYVYGGSEAETTQAVNLLREAGFRRVAHLRGGIQAWQEVEGQVEGVIEVPEPGEYNVMARMAAFGREKSKEKSVN
ncbi:MAG: rhodanese-like domain-containing protein [Pegethrix bostrychoides GSE-TBD4-15B]|jgi:rhodanese-related sulfurtransferase|uniref:Rhodanese-like domain-containing protein n=1 Tax=Pegethrix bostrychoides GSE-TBD4-15B TaxID=2839662 RepID=A0A951P8M1_9CYAN|nr:rhodanese-like domain-containing protein [Pegethrix bostrychoides GSE-TBD4-15B]